MTAVEWEALMGDLRFVCTLSDSCTEVELLPRGRRTAVTYADRHAFARLARRARWHESDLQVR